MAITTPSIPTEPELVRIGVPPINLRDWRAHPMYQMMSASIERVARQLNLTATEERELLKHMLVPDRIIVMKILVSDDTYTYGVRTQFDNTLGAYQGGMRRIDTTDPDASLLAMIPESVGLGQGMVLKSILCGGGKGFVLRPTWFSDEQWEEALYSFGCTLAKRELIGPDIDGLGPDMYMAPEDMACMQHGATDALGGCLEETICMTGLPPHFPYALQNREEATGWYGARIMQLHLTSGIRHGDRKALEELGPDVTVAYHGFGQVNQHAALRAAEMGCTMYAVADKTGAFCSPDGVNVDAAIKYCRNNGNRLEGFSGAEEITHEEFFGLPVTVMTAASKEHVITEERAARFNAQVLVAAGNKPEGPRADPILDQRSVERLPSILVSAGGVRGSQLAQQQARSKTSHTPDEVRAELDRQATDAFEAFTRARTMGLGPTDAANYGPMQNLAMAL